MQDPLPSAHNYTPINTADYQTSNQNSVTKKRHINYLNLSLLLLTCTSLLGLAFAVRTSQTVINTNAAYNKNADMEMKMMGMEIGEYRFPKTYRGTSIPETLYTSAKDSSVGEVYVNDYIKDQVIRYYVYKNVLEENDIDPETENGITDFANLKDAVASMEKLVRTNLISTRDFAYIVAHYSSNSPESKTKAENLVNTYKTKLDEGITLESVVDEANADAELTEINGTEKSSYFIDFDGTYSIFPVDRDYKNALLDIPEGKVSEPYILHDQNDIEIAYVITKVEKINSKKYNSLNQIISEQELNFAY